MRLCLAVLNYTMLFTDDSSWAIHQSQHCTLLFVIISSLQQPMSEKPYWEIYLIWTYPKTNAHLPLVLLASATPGWPGDLCGVFIQKVSSPSGAHGWFSWAFVTLMEITSIHLRARFFPKEFILPQCANIILIKINRSCTHASWEEMDS